MRPKTEIRELTTKNWCSSDKNIFFAYLDDSDVGLLPMSLESRTASRNGSTADIVILGAGVMGTAIAFHLAKRKAGKIVILDKGHVAQGGSGRSSALIRMHYSYPPEVQLALVSLEMFKHWSGRGWAATETFAKLALSASFIPEKASVSKRMSKCSAHSARR